MKELAVQFEKVTKRYRHETVLKGMDLKLASENFSVLLGAPGSGKSVLLRLLTGLERPTSGEIRLRGRPATNMSPTERNLGYIPQSFALYPHYTVFENIAYPLRLGRAKMARIRSVVQETAELLSIEDLLRKKPDQLSGGEKQRVAIARGVAKESDIFVFDDPLTGLDFKLRERLFDDLTRVRQSLSATFVYTTSDPLEAMMLADDVFLLENGVVVEDGTLEEVYERPRTLSSVSMLGFPRANVLPGRAVRSGTGLQCDTELFSVPLHREQGDVQEGDELAVAIRPQDLELGIAERAGSLAVECSVELTEDLGSERIVHLKAGETRLVSITSTADEEATSMAGSMVASFALNRIFVFAQDGARPVGVRERG